MSSGQAIINLIIVVIVFYFAAFFVAAEFAIVSGKVQLKVHWKKERVTRRN